MQTRNKKRVRGLLLRLFSLLIIFMFVVVISLVLSFCQFTFYRKKRHGKLVKAKYIMMFPSQLLMQFTMSTTVFFSFFLVRNERLHNCKDAKSQSAKSGSTAVETVFNILQ